MFKQLFMISLGLQVEAAWVELELSAKCSSRSRSPSPMLRLGVPYPIEKN
jgi:hypothetical protein